MFLTKLFDYKPDMKVKKFKQQKNCDNLVINKIWKQQNLSIVEGLLPEPPLIWGL
jgi:hypothetical protein